MPEFDRQNWLRALRTMNDDYILDLLDQAIRSERAGAWEECYESGTPWLNPYRETKD